jgi:predicted nucleotidyltransferase
MSTTNTRPDEHQLEQLVRRIVEAVHPLRIILFGSAARGEMGTDSDVDLLVVMPEGTHRRDAAGEIYYRVRGVKLPFEVLVTTPNDLEKHRENPGLIYRTILREGRTIYAA